MVRRIDSLLPIVFVIFLLVPLAPAMGQEIDAWELGIMYPNEDADNPFEISKDGKAKVEFFVENSGFVEISV